MFIIIMILYNFTTMIITTSDGSHTIQVEDSGITYHSIHGAIGESMHVYIQAGLDYYLNKHKPTVVNIFEMGFGTGLNAFLTLKEAIHRKVRIHYTAVETNPLKEEEYSQLNYADLTGDPQLIKHFNLLHLAEWNQEVHINEYFIIEKKHQELQSYLPRVNADIIYYDAFGPGPQPELWTEEVFAKIYTFLKQHGILVTYCSKSDVRRAMQKTGFLVEKIQGPRGKREMLRAIKL